MRARNNLNFQVRFLSAPDTVSPAPANTGNIGCNLSAPAGSVFRETSKSFQAMKNITELNGKNFETEVLQAAGPVLVDFYAPWCGPCRMLAPLLEQLAGEFAGRVKFAKLNVDDAPEWAARYDITGVPTLILFRGGIIVDQIVGLPAPSQLKAWLKQNAGEIITT
jgi:thioredoxin 1